MQGIALPYSPFLQSVKLTASIATDAGPVDEGIVVFEVFDGTMSIGTSQQSTVTNGSASVDYILPAGLSRGAYTISASLQDSADFNPSTDSSGVLTVYGPALFSGPSASPSVARVGEIVTFSVIANDAFGDSLSYVWMFGDSLTGNGATIGHVYAVPGAYSVSIIISDGRGGTIVEQVNVTVLAPVFGSGIDSDGDGYSDSFEITAGTDPFDAASTPLEMSLRL